MSQTTPDKLVIDAPPAYVRRPWAVRWAIGLILLGAVLNLLYLWHNCPLDLAGDEAHYWEWSRHLDYGYYSKPAGIAFVHWLATHIAAALGAPDGGAAMPVLRTAAVVFSVISGLLSMALARRVFRDDRAGLMVTVLSAGVPMFVVGALLITIDSPMYACWAASAYALWRHVEEPRGKGPGWLYLAGFFVGLGMLFKPVLIAVPVCAAIAAWASPVIRGRLRTWHSLGAGLLALVLQTPVVVWNWQHNWVTFRHVGGQGYQEAKKWYDPLARMGEYLGGQAGGMGGVMFVLLVIAVVMAVQAVRSQKPEARSQKNPSLMVSPADRAGLVFLLAFTLPLWMFYLALNLTAKTQPNWPAASYFAGMILLGGVATRMWAAGDRGWKHWTIGAVAWGLVLATLGQNMQWFYPLVREKVVRAQALVQPGARTKVRLHPRGWDLTWRLRGLQAEADVVEAARAQMARQSGRSPLVAATRYDDASSLAFHLPGKPFVYCIMSRVGGRHSQYDLWPGLDPKEHAGADVLLVAGDGDLAPEVIAEVIEPAFERVGAPEYLPVTVAGMVYREVCVRRCYGFKGFPAGKDGGHW